MNRQPWNKGTKKVPFWGDHRYVPVTTGANSRDTERVFTRGQCHSLAFALHELTGWPVVLLCYDEDLNVLDAAVGDPYSWGHAVVRRPDGLLVDINGAWTLDESPWSFMFEFEAGTPDEALDYIAGSCDYV